MQFLQYLYEYLKIIVSCQVIELGNFSLPAAAGAAAAERAAAKAPESARRAAKSAAAAKEPAT